MTDFLNHCFVCGSLIDPDQQERNKQINLPVCEKCKGTPEEKKAVDELNEEMADGFVCGCI
jgi:predicted nucleic acid-binding Zn ribbon protein